MKKPLLLSSLFVGGLFLCLSAAPASAQDATQPPSSQPMSPPPSSSSSSSFAGGGIGVGATQWLSGTTGAEFVYDQPMFHIEGLLGYDHISHADNTSDSNFRIGASGWYHLSRGSMADFSLGGGAALIYISGAGAGASRTEFALEPGAQARVFLTPSFALTARVGLLIMFGDNNSDTTFSIAGQPTAGFGFTYFFR